MSQLYNDSCYEILINSFMFTMVGHSLVVMSLAFHVVMLCQRVESVDDS